MEVIPTIPLAIALAIPFLVTFAALHFILFKPLLAYLQERRHAVVSARHETEALSHEIESRMTELESRLAAAREEVGAHRLAARSRAQAHEASVLTEARGKADERVKSAIVEIAAEQQRAASQMQAMAATLSQEIATQVLGRSVESR